MEEEKHHLDLTGYLAGARQPLLPSCWHVLLCLFVCLCLPSSTAVLGACLVPTPGATWAFGCVPVVMS